MNPTVWHSLTGFVQYLGKEGICHVDQTKKGWFIAYVDNVDKEAEMQRKAKAEKDDEERQREIIEAQLQRAREKAGDEAEYKPSELIRNEGEKIAFSLAPARPIAEGLSKPLLGVAGSVFDSKKLDMRKKSMDSDNSTVDVLAFGEGEQYETAAEEMREAVGVMLDVEACLNISSLHRYFIDTRCYLAAQAIY